MIDSIKVWYSCSDHDSTLGPIADESLNSLTMDLHGYFVLKYYGVYYLLSHQAQTPELTLLAKSTKP